MKYQFKTKLKKMNSSKYIIVPKSFADNMKMGKNYCFTIEEVKK